MADADNEQSDNTDISGDGAFSQEDIDALLNGDGEAAEAPSGADATQGPQAASSQSDSQEISQADIDALLSAAGTSGEAEPDTSAAPAAPEPDTRVDTLGRPFDEAAAAMAAAIEDEKGAGAPAVAAPGGAAPPVPVTPRPDTKPLELADLRGATAASVDAKRVTMLNDVNLRVKLQLGQTRMLVEDVLKLTEGSVVELDKLAGDPVDVLVNDRLVARGEVLVLNDNFCVRVSEVLSHDPHRVTQ